MEHAPADGNQTVVLTVDEYDDLIRYGHPQVRERLEPMVVNGTVERLVENAVTFRAAFDMLTRLAAVAFDEHVTSTQRRDLQVAYSHFLRDIANGVT